MLNAAIVLRDGRAEPAQGGAQQPRDVDLAHADHVGDVLLGEIFEEP
jgi:hypothetical protein